MENEGGQIEKKSMFREARFAIAFVLFSLILSLLIAYNKDFLLVFIVTGFCYVLLAISGRTRIKVLLRLIALFLFLHLLVFPFIYVELLAADPKSFEFDKTVLFNEARSSSEDVYSEYKPRELKVEQSIVNAVLTDSAKFIDTPMSALNNGNVFISRNFLLNKSCKASQTSNHPDYDACLAICNTEGKNLIELRDINGGCQFKNEKISIRQFLINRTNDAKEKLADYSKKTFKINRDGNIWTMRGILSYSINFFYTSNMVAKSRTANIITFIHAVFVVSLILGVLGNIISAFMMSGKSQTKNEDARE